MILQNEFPVRPLSGQFVRDHGPLLLQIARRVWPRAAGRSSPTLTACDEACKETLNLARARLRDDPESRDEVVSITRLKRCSPEGPRSVDPSGKDQAAGLHKREHVPWRRRVPDNLHAPKMVALKA
jgi:hypothetical protein